MEKWHKTIGRYDSLACEKHSNTPNWVDCVTSWNYLLDRMTITALCCKLPINKLEEPSKSTFEVGETYICRYADNASIDVSFKVIKKSSSFVTLSTGKRCKIYTDNHTEFCYPEGKYSMSLVLRASRQLTKIHHDRQIACLPSEGLLPAVKWPYPISISGCDREQLQKLAKVAREKTSCS